MKETIESEASEDQSDVCEYSAKRSDRAICLLCKSVVIAKGGNTLNLLAYLRVHHPSKFAEVQTAMKRVKRGSQEKLINGCKKKQLTLQDALKPKYNCQSKKWQQLIDSVTFCLAKDIILFIQLKRKVSGSYFTTLTHSMSYPAENISQKQPYLFFILKLKIKLLQK